MLALCLMTNHDAESLMYFRARVNQIFYFEKMSVTDAIAGLGNQNFVSCFNTYEIAQIRFYVHELHILRNAAGHN